MCICVKFNILYIEEVINYRRKTMEKIKFSIIIPIYGVEEYLNKCVNSVLSQLYENMEIILVDDGSPDSCGKICEEYATRDDRVRVIHKINGGLSDTRNIGLRIATGDYTLFLDSDDYWCKDFLLEVSNIISDNPVDVLICDGYYGIFPQGSRFDNITYLEEKINNFNNGEQALEYLLKFKNKNGILWRWAAWNNIYKTKFLKDNNLYFKKGIICEDAEWTPRVILKAESFFLYKNPFYMYRLERANSIMNMCSVKKIYDLFEIVENWIEYSNKLNNSVLETIIKERFSNDFSNYLKYIYIYDKDIRSDLTEIIKKGEFINYLTGNNNYLVKLFLKILGYEPVLLYLNVLYRIRTFLRRVLKKFKILKR